MSLTIRCLPVLLLLVIAIEARAGGQPWRSCPCDAPVPFEPAAIWYGWGGAIGRMAPVPPPPPMDGHCDPPAVWYGWGGAVGVMVPLVPHHPLPLAVPAVSATRTDSKGPTLTPP